MGCGRTKTSTSSQQCVYLGRRPTCAEIWSVSPPFSRRTFSDSNFGGFSADREVSLDGRTAVERPKQGVDPLTPCRRLIRLSPYLRQCRADEQVKGSVSRGRPGIHFRPCKHSAFVVHVEIQRLMKVETRREQRQLTYSPIPGMT